LIGTDGYPTKYDGGGYCIESGENGNFEATAIEFYE